MLGVDVERLLEEAKCGGGEREDPYDPLLDDYEPGMTTAEVAQVLSDLKEALVPLVAEVSERTAAVDDSLLGKRFPVERQREVVRRMLHALPMPSDSWRLDETTHPFQLSMSPTALRFLKQSFNVDTEHLAGVGQLAFTGLGLFVRTDEAEEGVRAFNEKRQPDFSPFRARVSA